MKHFLKLYHEAASSNWELPALSDYKGRTYTHHQVAAEILRLHSLYSAIGLEKGDKIALCGKNCARWAISFFSVATYHAVCVPILHGFTPADVVRLTAHSESRILFTESNLASQMDFASVEGLDLVLSLDDCSLLWCKDESLRTVYQNSYALLGEVEVTPEMMDFSMDDPEELVIINYTSGTTGVPKGVMVPARSISSNVQYGQAKIPARKGETALSMLPMAHMFGLTFEFIFLFVSGVHVYFLGKMPTPAILLPALKEIKPFIIITVPLLLEKIVRGRILPALEKAPARYLVRIPGLRSIVYNKIHDQLTQAFGGNVRLIPSGGSALAAQVEDVLLKARIPFSCGYGMTECGPLIGYELPGLFKARSCGRVVYNMEIRVDSEDPENVAGELQVRGQNVMLGYYKNPDATAAAFTEDGWLRTGDLGVIDKEGHIFIRGRSKNMILSSNGQNIYPEEIEDKINNEPEVLESLVLERKGKVVGIVALTQGEGVEPWNRESAAPVLDDLRRRVNQNLPSYSQISALELVDGAFEHTPKQSIKRALYK